MVAAPGKPSLNQEETTEPFLSQDAPDEKIEVSLVKVTDVPEPFKYCNPHKIENLFIKYSPESLPTSDILLENVIVEYKSLIGQERELQHENGSVKVTYLKTYVSVGIPTGRYRWLLRKVSELTKIASSPLSNYEDDDYTWLSAQLPVNDAVFEETKCYIYNSSYGCIKPVGTLHDVLDELKTNLVGFGQFKIRKMENFQNRHVVSFLLTGFQSVNTTTKQSYPMPSIPVSASHLWIQLKDLNLTPK